MCECVCVLFCVYVLVYVLCVYAPVCVWIADCFETVQAQLFRLPLTHVPAVLVSLGYA